MKLSVVLAKEARDGYLKENPSRCDDPPLIAGSVGPYGAYNSPDAAEYHGNYVDSMSIEVRLYKCTYVCTVNIYKCLYIYVCVYVCEHTVCTCKVYILYVCVFIYIRMYV